MARKIVLPHQDVVEKWDFQKVLKWLKKMQLEECIPAFEKRQIDGVKLLELTEQKLFTFRDVKIKHRGQISKCVNECKTQASNAKRIVGTIRQNKGKQKNEIATEENGSYYDSEDEFDYWDSDFDEDFDEEENSESPEQSEHYFQSDSSEAHNEVCNAGSLNGSETLAQTSVNIPKPPDVSVAQSAPSSNCTKPAQRNSIPRPPLKRPPSQPPPPPVSKTSSEPVEAYEIPISHQVIPSSLLLHASTSSNSSSSRASCASDSSLQAETYEVIQPVEETYEVIESPPLPVKAEKPVLPPRISPSTLCKANIAPPLPQKPKKFQEGIQSLERPKLPFKPTDENGNNTLAGSLGSVIVNSLMGRRHSETLPKPLSRMKDLRSSTVSNSSLNSSSSCEHLSQVPNDVDSDLFSVGNSNFLKNVVTDFLEDNQKSLTSAPLESDYGVTNMATRPLPPVPVPIPEIENKEQVFSDVCDLATYPWFHEIEREIAEHIIQDLGQGGSFLVRPSKRAGKDNPFTLTVLHDNKVFHLNIRLRPDSCYALGKEKVKEKSFPSVVSLIEYHRCEPILLTSRGESAGQTILSMFPEK